MQTSLAPTWQMVVLRGALAVVFGIMAMAWPISTVVALVTLWGVWALVDGGSSLVQAFVRPNPGLVRVGLALMGVVGLVAAFVAIFRPVSAAITLTWLLGIWLIARGLMELVLAVAGSAPAPRWLLVLSALVDFLLGLLFALNPGRSAVGIAFWLGVVALAWGVAFIAAGLTLRRETVTSEPAAPTAPAAS